VSLTCHRGDASRHVPQHDALSSVELGSPKRTSHAPLHPSDRPSHGTVQLATSRIINCFHNPTMEDGVALPSNTMSSLRAIRQRKQLAARDAYPHCECGRQAKRFKTTENMYIKEEDIQEALLSDTTPVGSKIAGIWAEQEDLRARLEETTTQMMAQQKTHRTELDVLRYQLAELDVLKCQVAGLEAGMKTKEEEIAQRDLRIKELVKINDSECLSLDHATKLHQSQNPCLEENLKTTETAPAQPIDGHAAGHPDFERDLQTKDEEIRLLKTQVAGLKRETQSKDEEIGASKRTQNEARMALERDLQTKDAEIWMLRAQTAMHADLERDLNVAYKDIRELKTQNTVRSNQNISLIQEKIALKGTLDKLTENEAAKIARMREIENLLATASGRLHSLQSLYQSEPPNVATTSSESAPQPMEVNNTRRTTATAQPRAEQMQNDATRWSGAAEPPAFTQPTRGDEVSNTPPRRPLSNAPPPPSTFPGIQFWRPENQRTMSGVTELTASPSGALATADKARLASTRRPTSDPQVHVILSASDHQANWRPWLA